MRRLGFRQWLLIAVCCLSGFHSAAQVVLAQKTIDMEILRRADANWVDFEIKNNTAEKVTIFRVTGSENTDVKLSAKTIAPHTSAYVRVAVSPPKEGSFNEKLEVFLSAWQKPQTIQVKGESTFAATSLIPCPDFSGNAASSTSEFFVSVRNLENTPISESLIQVYKDGRKSGELKTNTHGEAAMELPYGRYFFSIRKEGFQLDTALYVNAINNHLLAMVEYVEPAPVEPPPLEEIVETPPPPPPPPVIEEEPVAEVPVTTVPEEEDAPLPLSKYKENNLVFLIDVSASMRKDGRMDLLKIAMIELLDILRPYDKFTLMTYADDTKMIMEATTHLDKEACAEAILALEPRGSTEGAKAIDKAGKIALKHFVKGGNNQVIMATDGAFNRGVDQALRYVSKYERKDVRLSVLGIKCGAFTTKQMTTLVAQGSGRYIPIHIAEDAGSQLIEEVKKSSVR